MRALPLAVTLALTGCALDESGPDDSISSALSSSDCTNPGHDHDNPMLYRKDARPFGRTLERWAELTWSYIYAQPLDHNPFLDATGADCAIGQSGPVWFLPAVPGSTLGTAVTRTCTIPRHHAIMLQLASAMNDYPCPDPAFHPAPGQSLYEFLIDPIRPLFDGETGFTVTLDGVAVQDPLSYRFASSNVFHFTGNPSLQPFDPCVTGTRQQAVVDGFYLLFKALPPGHHTIFVSGHDMHGVPVTLTENLTIL